MKDVAALVIVVLFAFFLLWPRIRAYWTMRTKKGEEVTGLNEVIGAEEAKKPYIVLYFYSDGCVKCRGVTARVESLSKEKDYIFKIDAQKHRDWAVSSGVVGLPTIAVIANGKLKNMVFGSISERKLRGLVDAH